MYDLEQQLQRKNAQLAALREIGQAINAAWELEATLDLITRRTAGVMGMDSCSIYLLDDDGESLVLKATTGLAAESVGLAPGGTIPGQGLRAARLATDADRIAVAGWPGLGSALPGMAKSSRHT